MVGGGNGTGQPSRNALLCSGNNTTHRPSQKHKQGYAHNCVMLILPLQQVPSPPFESDGVTSGPAFGYHVNASKTWLITKEQFLPKVCELFRDTSVNTSPAKVDLTLEHHLVVTISVMNL